MPNLDSQTIQLAIVAAVAIVMLLQTIALLAIFIVVRKSARSMLEEVQDLRSSVVRVVDRVEPVVENVRELLAHTGPRIEAAAADLAVMSKNLRSQTNDIQTAATEFIERFRRQSARVDLMINNIFDVVDRAGSFMSDAVSKPMRQLAGILASAKAVVETLRTGAPEPPAPADHPLGDKDMFV
jgi:ABC-type transporter Mla subunit MlaD